jgi:predicted  nucleic acid-binding Zn-ribbon protein
MQEKAQALSHIDLVLSQFLMNVLKGLHISVTQEIHLCAESTTMELTKVTNDKATLHIEYSKVMMEQDEAEHKERRLKNAVQEVYKKFPEIPMEVDTPLEEQVSKISEAIQGFHTKIVDLEACTMPSTPLEEREKREKTTTTIVESIKSLEEECAKLYEESTQVWTQLTEDA